MKILIKHIISILPYLFTITFIFLIIRFFIIKRKKIKINWYRECALFLFVLFIVILFSQTTTRDMSEWGKDRFHETNFIPFKILIDTYNKKTIIDSIDYFCVNFFGNLLFFMPLGFFIPLLWKISDKKVIIIGFSLSLFFEICQLFLPRCSDIEDLFLNTLGTFLGLTIYKIIKKKNNKFIAKFDNGGA